MKKKIEQKLKDLETSKENIISDINQLTKKQNEINNLLERLKIEYVKIESQINLLTELIQEDKKDVHKKG